MSTTRHPAHKRAKHSARMPALSGVIHPTRTDAAEVLHAATRAELAWGRYVCAVQRGDKAAEKFKEREHARMRARLERLVLLLEGQEGDEGADR